MEIREEHKKEEEQQREEHEKALQRYKERRKKSSRQRQSSMLLLLYGAILVAAVVITILAMLLREEKKERAKAEEALAQIQREEQENPKLYTQEALDDIVVQITEDAAEEQRKQIREELRLALEEPGAGMTTTLRSFHGIFSIV